MKKINSVTLIKFIGGVLTLAGAAINLLANDKENKKLIDEAVEKRLQQK